MPDSAPPRLCAPEHPLTDQTQGVDGYGPETPPAGVDAELTATQMDILGFQQAPVALMVLANRRILRVNDKFETLFGWARTETEGQSVRLLNPSDIDYEKTGADGPAA